jgi:hypothetical protein
MKPLHTLQLLCATALIGTIAATASAQNIVNDPGFEASADGLGPHPFSAAWTVNDPSGFSNVGGDGTPPAHSGVNYANLGAFGQIGTLSQTLSTTPGTFYTLSFWLANNSALPTNSFQAFLNGSLVFATTSPPFTSAGNYVLITGAPVFVSGTSALLEFRYRHDDDFWRLDDINVSRAPEGGATLWLALPVLAGLCLVQARRRIAAPAVS